ncbi:hypothetical protein S40285_09441 [Stachybotrys chlorohalonatus IBT 40285]|uniref:Velvet domain-containing protein n=1 Tax=Stachybotrys chlorohalonatus (strain IBT 40285) TaxID=1283841 RepID=A0A084QTE9_STAC4|nr:hypothetical protein S40285_09441 [Stachybotrys chlorohalonata IBT 40285]
MHLRPKSEHAAHHRTLDNNKTIDVPNLYSESRIGAPNSLTFSLNIRQQPKAARPCGFGDKDRRTIDPPPIVELVIESPTLTNDQIQEYRRARTYVMSCSIWDKTGTIDDSLMPGNYKDRRLVGSVVGTPFVGKDEYDREGCFFTFPDLSCRTSGSFRLKFDIVMVGGTIVTRRFPTLAEKKSDVFHVYSAKDFPGISANTLLAKRLREQGCDLPLKSGNDKRLRVAKIGGIGSEIRDDYDADDERQKCCCVRGFL